MNYNHNLSVILWLWITNLLFVFFNFSVLCPSCSGRPSRWLRVSRRHFLRAWRIWLGIINGGTRVSPCTSAMLSKGKRLFRSSLFVVLRRGDLCVYRSSSVCVMVRHRGFYLHSRFSILVFTKLHFLADSDNSDYVKVLPYWAALTHKERWGTSTNLKDFRRTDWKSQTQGKKLALPFFFMWHLRKVKQSVKTTKFKSFLLYVSFTDHSVAYYVNVKWCILFWGPFKVH